MIKLHYGGQDHIFDENEIYEPNKHYERLCTINSDIHEHLPTLKKYAEDCNSVTEMGVRFACSTWAFIESKPLKLNCIDINYESFQPSEKFVKRMCEIYNIDFCWITGDTLEISIEETDLLFIDTLHTYNQLICELTRHSDKVKKYIILHDTDTFSDRDESIYEHASIHLSKLSNNKKGLAMAIQDFLEENKKWKIHKIFTNNNGLTILERIES